MKDDNRNEIADAIIFAARHLGSGEASMEGWGTIEFNGKKQVDAIDRHAEAINSLAGVMEDGFILLAKAIERKS